MAEQLGLTEAVSIALGGMIGGGIYAVLGVVVGIAGPATWAAFVAAGVVALATGYSYVTLNELDDDNRGGSVTFVQAYLGNATLAGMIGWTLLFGYVGSMAMYAFAFAVFAIELPAVPAAVGTVSLRPAISVLAVAAFVGLNLLGARATGAVENVLVALKIGVLVAFGVAGVAYAASGASGAALRFGIGELASFGPIMAAAVSFVAFQGWQLLFYDQESFADPLATIRRAVYVAIPVAVAVYVLVVLTTVALAPGALRNSPHVALARAARNVARPVGLAGAGALAISLSALVSTGSAINATLFSAGHFAKGMLSEGLLPDRIGDAGESGVPHRTLLVLGAITAAFTAVGSLDAITSFASLSFIVVFGTMSYLAFRQRDRADVNPVVPAVGTAGAAAFFPLLFYHLYRSERGTFYMVLVVAAAVLAVELLYFERDVLEEEVEEFEAAVESAVDERR